MEVGQAALGKNDTLGLEKFIIAKRGGNDIGKKSR
jgi:hypothetical protein